jgi:mRNA interferase MazF
MSAGTRGEVWFVEPDPSVGSELRKERPCLIVQPADMDRLHTTIVVPMTSQGFAAPFRVATTFGSSKYLLCDQVRSIDRQRLRRFAGRIDSDELGSVLRVLQAVFAP